MKKTLYEDHLDDVFWKSLTKYYRPQYVAQKPILGANFYMAAN